MLHILWMVIRFILILLGIILGLILFAILLVLFCPFRYYAAAEKLDDDFKKTKLYVSLSWLFHGVWVRIQFHEGVVGTKINLFGIPIHKILEKKKAKEIQRIEGTVEEWNDSEELEETDVLEEIEEPEKIDIPEEIKEPKKTDIPEETEEPEKIDIPEEIKEPEKIDIPKEIEEPEKIIVPEEANASGKFKKASDLEKEYVSAENIKSEEAEQDKTANILEKIRNILASISGKLKSVGKSGSMAEKVADKINTVKEKVQGILDKINWWKKFLTHPKVKGAVSCVKNAVIKILKHIIPTRLYGSIILGSEDPATTGTVLAIMGITMPFHKNCVEVVPLFEGKNVLTGKVQIKGRIYVFVLLFQALKVLINKNVRYTIKYWKNKEES